MSRRSGFVHVGWLLVALLGTVGIGYVSQQTTIPIVSEFVCNTFRDGTWVEFFGESGCLTADLLGESPTPNAEFTPTPQEPEVAEEAEPFWPSDGLPPPAGYEGAVSYYQPGTSEGPEYPWPTEAGASEWDHLWLDLDGDGDYVGLFEGEQVCVEGDFALDIPRAKCV